METLKELQEALERILTDPKEGAKDAVIFLAQLYRDFRTFPEARERYPSPADRVRVAVEVVSGNLAPFREDEKKAALFVEKVYEAIEKFYGPLHVEGMAAVAAIAEEIGQTEIAQKAKVRTQEKLVAVAKEALEDIRQLEAERRVRVVEL